MLNSIIIGLLVVILLVFIGYLFSKSGDSAVLQDVQKESRIYSIEKMTEFIKARMDEITRTNLYDIGLSEDELRRRFGKRVRIERLEFHRTKPTIINDKHTCTNLALAYVKHAEDIVERHEESIFEDKIKDLNNLKIYDEIIYSVNLEKPEFIEPNDLEDWRSDKINRSLEELGLIDKFGHLDRSLKKDLKENRFSNS